MTREEFDTADLAALLRDTTDEGKSLDASAWLVNWDVDPVSLMVETNMGTLTIEQDKADQSFNRVWPEADEAARTAADWLCRALGKPLPWESDG